MRTDFCTVRVFAFLVLLRQRKLRPQVGEHFVVGLLGDVHGGAAGVGFGLDDAYHMQGAPRAPKVEPPAAVKLLKDLWNNSR